VKTPGPVDPLKHRYGSDYHLNWNLYLFLDLYQPKTETHALKDART